MIPEILTHKRFLGDVFWTLAGQLASAVALLAGTRVLTELVTPDIFGKVALLNGFVALGVSLFSYPFICAGMRTLPECVNQAERSAVYRIVFGLTARANLIAIAFFLIAGMYFGPRSGIPFLTVCLTGCLLMVTVRRELGFQLLIGERKQRRASFWQTSDSLLRPILAVSLVWWYGPSLECVLLGYILAGMIANGIWGVLVKERTATYGFPTARNVRAEIWSYALPLIPMELIFWINGLGDRYVIGFFMSAADVGIYSAAYLIINEAFNRCAMLLHRIFQPIYFQSCSNKRTEEGIRVLWIWIGCVFVLVTGGVGLLILTKEWLASVLLAHAYHSAVELMPAIAIGCALHAIGTVLAQPLLAKKQTRLVFFGRLSGVITAAISLPVLVLKFGLFGAAVANPIYFGVEALVLGMLAKPWQKADTEMLRDVTRSQTKRLGYEISQ